MLTQRGGSIYTPASKAVLIDCKATIQHKYLISHGLSKNTLSLAVKAALNSGRTVF